MNSHRNWEASLYIVTWNVSSKYPDNIRDLHKLLGLESKPENDTHQPDFYVIGLQEVNAQPQNVVMGLFKEDPWTEKIREVLKSRNYVVVKTEQMLGLLVILLTKRHHLTHVRQVETEYTRCGLGGLWGNKGAVSIRMNWYGTTICLVNAHLAAHDHNLDERIEDYETIIKEQKFKVKPTQEIFDHDYVFWFGDLNFRLTGEATTSPEDIRAMIKDDRLSELIEKDQLLLIRQQKRAFHEFQERLPSFPPTFKFEHGTDDYNMKRRPAWTDRVLYRVQDKKYCNVALKLEQSSYKCHPGFYISDHKPVTSEFVLKVFSRPDILKRDAGDYIDSNVPEQLFEDLSEVTVDFKPIEVWHVGQEMVIEFTLPADYEEGGGDWIGIFKEDFSSLDAYVAYDYTSHSKTEYMENCKTPQTMQIEFPDSVDLDHNQTYVLMFIQSTGTKGVFGPIGISEPFRAEKPPKSHSPSPTRRVDELF